jgi:cellobiose epimerase
VEELAVNSPTNLLLGKPPHRSAPTFPDNFMNRANTRSADLASATAPAGLLLRKRSALSWSFQYASKRGLLVLGFFLTLSMLFGVEKPVQTAAAEQALDPQELLRQAERCRKILRENIIDFYLPASIDQKNGGYLESLRDGRFVATGEKFLTLQARQLWFFSTLAIEGYEKEKALSAAQSGFKFLQARMFDPVHGGYYSKVTDDGSPRDTRKHAYLNSFALYGLTAYAQATRDPAALEAAGRLFHVLDEKAYDRQNGGYIEFFYRDWTPVEDRTESGYVGAIGHKTYNTHLHLLEAFAELYRAWPDNLLARRLQELITINTSTVRYPRADSNVDAFHRDWQVVVEPRNLRASYGHDVECAWLTLDAVRTLGLTPIPYRNWAEALCRSSIEHGYDRKHGGFYSSGPLGQRADDTKKIWWVQSEALVGLLEMFKLTGQREYYDLFSQTLDFTEEHQVAKEGSWWATRAADGSATADRQRSGPWQGAYHSGRAMILCAKQLEGLAQSLPGAPSQPR